MNQNEIVEYSNSKGAHAEVKQFRDSSGQETVSIFTEPLPVDSDTGIECWRNGIWVGGIDDRWKIGFSQFGTTRSLSNSELIQLIDQWIKNPSFEVFAEYENT